MQKQLTKSKDKIVAGVLGGIAEYFDWDKAWTRIGGAVLIFGTGFGLLVYIAAAIVIPDSPHHDNISNGDYYKP
ncbi:PspC domain-containing protein [Lactobacillus xylocopicola]|uniref:Phage shock protein PspC N-terminal domain-containing protein n=1 Tax=Lactobacillus xylocopicola TaxID=2976676 RepID=A0ABN6SNN3_9LACO|nr:PspC domain-containing protein [Lactobacillus xylocopicola]BDR60777.1 hypothetical protein KIM322_10380 [Lactobacillus xylocopicola]